MIIKSIPAPLRENLYETAILFGVFTLVYLISFFLIKFKIKTTRRKEKIRTRFKYVIFILFFIFLIQIWMDKFFQILAFIGFLSAAVTITQRDNITNFIAWFIINWRELFLEGDTIQINKMTGCVKAMGPLYITLHECFDDRPAILTGRTIKIPNGMVAKNPVINFSTQHKLHHKLEYVFEHKTDLDRLKQHVTQLAQEAAEYCKTTFHKNHMDFGQIGYALRQSKIGGLVVSIHFEASLEEYAAIKVFFDDKFLKLHHSQSEVQLVFE